MTIMAIDNYVDSIHEAPLHSRKSIRLKGYDYSQTGAYFVTICAHNREILFGMVGNDKSQLNKFGQIVETEWLITAQIRENIELDEYAIMPNHFHGILLITDNGMGTALRAHTIEQFGKPVSGSLPTIIRSFKSTVTKQINQLRNTPGSSVWQRNYYEHIIRNEDGLNRIREYIINNPIQWQFDRENPHHIIGKTYHNNWGKTEELIYGRLKNNF